MFAIGQRKTEICRKNSLHRSQKLQPIFFAHVSERILKALVNNFQSAVKERRRIGIVPLHEIKRREIRQAYGQIGMIGAQRFFINRNDTHVGRSLQAYGEWAEPKIALFRQIVRAGDVVIEAGANLGAHTIFLSRQVGDAGCVIACEPARHSFQLLCANLVANGCVNVMTMQKAVGAEVGAAEFPLLDPRRAANFGGASLQWPWADKTERVASTTLDALAPERLDFIKASVAGDELELLAGARESISRHRPVVYVDIYHAGVRNQAVAQLEKMDYSCWYYITSLHDPDNWRGQGHDVLKGYSFDMVCVPNERYEVSGMLRAGVDDNLVTYLDGQIRWAATDWRLACISRREFKDG